MAESQEQVRRELARLFARVRNQREFEVFIEGLFTPPEVEDFVGRLRLMRRLRDGEAQRDISKDLGVSLGKIARGSRLLKYGPPQFRELLERLLTQESQEEEQRA